MPFNLKWPFRWPGRKPAEPEAARPAPAPAAPEAAAFSPAPERLFSAAAPEPRYVYTPEPGEGPDIGTELLSRLPQMSTPPTLGQLGGLTAMAQTLPTVDRFMQQMPAAPVQRLLEGAWSNIDQFTTSLPALSTLGGVPGEAGAPSFPEQLTASTTNAGLTDVLPPMGSLPGQVPAMSGEAPVLTPTPDRPPPQIVQVVHEAGPAASAPEMPVLRALERPAQPGATGATPADRPVTPGAPVVVQPLLTPVARAQEAPLGLAGMIQLISVESTLTGNVLPASEYYPVLRELVPYAPVWRQAEADTPINRAIPAASEERVTPVQRAEIEAQRGQGQPLAPGLRQQFEGAYGASLNEVRVHTGQAAHETAQSLNAIAFASGPDLFFSQNTYQPQSPQGLGLIGHELAHVVQQQYGVAGDPDALRTADDHFERQADRLAASALDTPLATTNAPAKATPVQRALLGQFTPVANEAPSPWTPGATLDRAAELGAASRPLSIGAAAQAEADEDAPIQRFGLGDIGSMASRLPAQVASLPSNLPTELPTMDEAADRVSGLTDQLPNPGGMLSNLGGLGSMGSNLPAMSSLSGLASNLPSLSGGLPSLSNLPGSIGGLTDQLPAMPGGLGQLAGGLPGLGGLGQLASGLPGIGSLPSMGGLSQALGGGLPDMPGLGDLPDGGGLPSLDGLQLPDMPLAEGLGGAASAAGGALTAGQAALGNITSMAPAMPELPSTPPLPSLEKITEHIWKQVQHRLKVERERSRGLA